MMLSIITFIFMAHFASATEYCIVDFGHCQVASSASSFSLDGRQYSNSYEQYGNWNFVKANKDYCKGPVCSGMVSCQVSYKDCESVADSKAQVYIAYATANATCPGACPKNIDDCIRDQTADAADNNVGFKNKIPSESIKPEGTLIPRDAK